MESVYEPSRSFLDFHIAGFAHYDGLSVISDLKLGTKVDLMQEPKNPYDPQAVAIYFKGVKLGYIPRDKNGVIFSILYFGHEDIFESYINLFDDDAHPERQFRVLVRIADNRQR